jgi:hypothetical protein
LKHDGQLGIIYSQFVGIGGLAALARFLDQNNYAGRYAIISGEVDIDKRAAIIDRFCASDNMHGEKCALLLISSTGSEGIDLKNVRHVHILEPYWNYGRIKQVKARAIRNGSHTDLPPTERNVATYIYIAIAPGSGEHEITSDEELYENARTNQLLIDSYESALKEVAIECALNYTAIDRPAHCRICAPSNDAIFSDNIESDMRAHDPCTPIVSRHVTAQKIKIGAEVFAYKIAPPASVAARVYGYEIFVEDPRIRAWRKLPLNDARYSAVVAAITNASVQDH